MKLPKNRLNKNQPTSFLSIAPFLLTITTATSAYSSESPYAIDSPLSQKIIQLVTQVENLTEQVIYLQNSIDFPLDKRIDKSISSPTTMGGRNGRNKLNDSQ